MSSQKGDRSAVGTILATKVVPLGTISVAVFVPVVPTLEGGRVGGYVMTSPCCAQRWWRGE